MTLGGPAWKGLLPILACVVCRRPLAVLETFGTQDAVLGHAAGECGERYPVIDDVPRLLVGPARHRLLAERSDWFGGVGDGWFASWRSTETLDRLSDAVVAGFDQEWRAFADTDTSEQAAMFEMYFDLVSPTELAGAAVLDAGCGAGRWAVQVAKRRSQVVALDAGRSVEIAARSGRAWGIQCVQGDVTRLPFESSRFDLVYSLGVLHHIEATESAAAELVRVLRPGGKCLIYLYYALDGRGLAFRWVYRAVDMIRRILSRSPRVVVSPISAAIAALVYLPLARTSRLLRTLGLRRAAAAIPLSTYADRSFRTMRNDSLDRFGTRLEKRFTRDEIARLMETAGLVDIRVAHSAPYWHAIGRRPS